MRRVLLIFALLLAACGGAEANDDAGQRSVRQLPTATSRPAVVRVDYAVRVTGHPGSGVRIRYRNETGGSEAAELTDRRKWSERFAWDARGLASVTASLPRDADADTHLSCEVLAEGRRVEYTEARGPGGQVTCSVTIDPADF